MKQTIIFILCVVIIIIALFWIKYLDYKNIQSEIAEENLEYETYLGKEITGRELTTLINRAVNSNEENNVEKDEQGFYIANDTNSVKIDIQMLDDEGNIYQMETFYGGGMVTFIQYYSDIYFECTRNRL